MLQTIEVPETLLKKRKQNEKAREEKLAAAVAARKVRSPSLCMRSLKPSLPARLHTILNDGYDFCRRMASWSIPAMSPSINHLSGLTLFLEFPCGLSPSFCLTRITQFILSGIKSQKKGHLQARRILCERIPDQRERGNPHEARCQVLG
jgi:hypothetical protein